MPIFKSHLDAVAYAMEMTSFGERNHIENNAREIINGLAHLSRCTPEYIANAVQRATWAFDCVKMFDAIHDRKCGECGKRMKKVSAADRPSVYGLWDCGDHYLYVTGGDSKDEWSRSLSVKEAA